MASDLSAILKLEVPVIVILGSRDIRLKEITALMPGAILELPKSAEEELELLINNKVVATGRAVKVGENFGLRISFVGDVRTRVAALAAEESAQQANKAELDADALAEAMLAGQA